MDGVIVVRGALLTARERRIAKSPWPSLNRAQGFQWLCICALPFIPLAYLAAVLDASTGAVMVSGAIILAGLFVTLWLASNVMAVLVREIMRTPTGAEADDWRIDSENVQFSSSLYQSTLKWRALVDAAETPLVFHFIMSPTQIFALPKRCLSEEDAELLRTLIASARERGDLKGVPA